MRVATTSWTRSAIVVPQVCASSWQAERKRFTHSLDVAPGPDKAPMSATMEPARPLHAVVEQRHHFRLAPLQVVQRVGRRLKPVGRNHHVSGQPDEP